MKLKLLILLGTLLFSSLVLVAQDATPEANKPENQLPPTPTNTPIPVPPLTGEQVPPPYTLELPEGWLAGYDVYQFVDIDTLRAIPVAVYSGPVEGGQGFIINFWNYPSYRGISPDVVNDMTLSLWSDGLRLLRLALIEQGCNTGTDLQREFPIGELMGVGTQFAAVNCPSTSDTRGWFAAVQVDGINFAFYMFTEPIEAMEVVGEGELQEILDSVEFTVDLYREDIRRLTEEQEEADEQSDE